MKVSLNFKNEHVNQGKNVSFGGYKPVVNDFGIREFEFSYPFDEDNQHCYVEIFTVNKNDLGNFSIKNKACDSRGRDRFPLSAGINRINLTKMFGIDSTTPFAYHYVVTNNNESVQKAQIDAGDSICERENPNDVNDFRIYNIVDPSKSDMSKGGAMKLVIPDSQNVGVVYKNDGSYETAAKIRNKREGLVKTLWNKLGGSLAGFEKDIDEGKYDRYARIISLPIFGRDNLSAHGYWTEELNQISPNLGNINNYASLQRKLFAHGINWVSDGAFVNEGLQGVHFQHVMKYGDDSPFFNWFNGSSLDGGLWSLGVFPKDTKNVTHKLVNPPYLYRQSRTGEITKLENERYDASKPTYIQFFDKTLVSDEEKNNPQVLIKNYSKQPENPYKLNTHNDSIFPYSFEIDPKIYDINIQNLIEYNSYKPKDERVFMDSYMGTRMLSKFENWSADGKHESGFETWNANPDIAKLRFVFSNTDLKRLKNMPSEERQFVIEDIKRANAQVQDYTIEASKYWTRLTNDIQRLYIAQNLKNISNNDVDNPAKLYKNIIAKSDNKTFPASLKYEVSCDEVSNVLSGMYNYQRTLSEEDAKSQILRQIMDFPLESLEFGSNIVAAFASPMISKRANTFDEIGVSRFDLSQQGNINLPDKYRKTYDRAEKFLNSDVYNFIYKVLKSVDRRMSGDAKLFVNDELTDYGKYVLPIIVPQITKYAIVKSIIPNIKVSVDSNGEISYDYAKMHNTHLETLGIKNISSPSDEAEQLLSKLEEGLKKLSTPEEKEIVKSIEQTLQGTNIHSFRLADLIIDKTQSGLDWRIDAAKDIADVEALNNNNANFEDTLQAGIDFWSRFSTNILQANPKSYLVVELTDEDGMHTNAWGDYSVKFPSKNDIEPKFLRETGMTSTANYTYFFMNLARMFSKSFEDKYTEDEGNLAYALKNILINGNRNFFKGSSIESVLYSYTFVANHDKPRPLHCAALDMDMFYTDLLNTNNKQLRKDAYLLLTDRWLDPEFKDEDVEHYNFAAASPKAVAMGMAIRKAAIDILEGYRNKMSKDEFDKAFKAISKSICDLSNGRYKNEHFDPDAFGVKPIDLNIDMIMKLAKEQYGLPDKIGKEYSDAVFERVLDPAISKLLGIMKYLVALPGMPTIFDGDDLGATGYDTKSKNIYLGCRSRRHDEWADKGNSKYKDFIAKHKKEIDDVMSIRRKPECNALNNGAPFVLPYQHAYLNGAAHNQKNKIDVLAVYRQSTDGRMAISLFNPKMHHDRPNEQYNKFLNTEYYSPEHLQLDEIRLNYCDNGDISDGVMGVGISGIKPGTIFHNANNPDDTYKVVYDNGLYYLKREGFNPVIDLNDSTLVLYSAEKTPLSFTGRCDVKLPAKFVANSYKSKDNLCGNKLLLTK